MTDETPTPEEQEALTPFPFPTLALIQEQFLTEDGIDADGLTTEQLLSAVREAFFMHHQAVGEVVDSIKTMGLLMGHLDDRIENMTATPTPASPLIVLPNRKDS